MTHDQSATTALEHEGWSGAAAGHGGVAVATPVRERRARPLDDRLDERRGTVPDLTVNLAKLAGIVAVVTVLAWIINLPRALPLNYYLSVAWSLYLPIAVIGVFGALRSRRLTASRFTGTIDNLIVFVIPTVARHDVLPALHRVIDSVRRYAPWQLNDFRIHVVVDEGAEGIPALAARYSDHPLIDILVVPESYRTPNGAMHKGRANHYALEVRGAQGLNRDDVFVYHLDDDTAVGPDTIASIAEFVHHDDGSQHLAQGVLAFPHHLAMSRFTVLADSIRPADDLTRFQFFTGWLRRPLGGLHGEHLLVRASIEADVGWDFGRTKVEDAYFALRFASRHPGRSTFLNSFSYGASPGTVGDLVKQRRRWAGGLISLLFDRGIPWGAKLPLGYAVAIWTTGIFQHVSIVLLVALLIGMPGTSPVASWLVPIWSFGLGYLMWAYLEGLRVNLQASGRDRQYLPYAALTVPAVFVFALVEAWSAALGLKDALTGKHDFTVISKRC